MIGGDVRYSVTSTMPRMVLKGRLTSATSKRTLYMRKFSSVPNVTGREIQPRGITDTKPTPENEREGWSFDIRICSFLKTTRLIRLRVAPPSVRIWYSLMLVMVGEMINGSCPAPDMLLGQSEASKLIGVSTHLRCGATLGAGWWLPPPDTGF
jgi:hypothetical protein